jgi:transposase-like protein
VPRLRQTIGKLQSDLADSASKISQLNKSKIELERTIKQSEQERLAAENAKYEIDKARIADKTQFDAVLAQLNAEKAEAIAELQAWQLLAYAAFAAFVALLIVSASVLFTWWRTARATYPSFASQTKLLAPPTQPDDEDAETSVRDASQTSLADTGESRECRAENLRSRLKASNDKQQKLELD